MRYSLCLLVLFALMSLSACDSFLEREPISQQSTSRFYKTPEDFRTAVQGAYDALQLQGTFGRNYYLLFEMRSDNTDQGADVTGLAAALAAINEFNEIPTSPDIAQAWIDSYAGVQRCNLILASIDEAEGLSPELTDQYTGEALFVRSLLYYYIAMAWGNVPLVLDATRYPDIPAINQVPAEEVYSQIIKDLKQAEQLLPERYTAGQAGRATKGAAAALLGKVLLTVGQNEEAETVLRSIVDEYDYRLLDDYGNLWGRDRIENSAESIFEIQFTSSGQDEGSRYTNTFAPSSDVINSLALAENRPTEDLLEAYEVYGERFDASMDTTYVNADGEVVAARYITKYMSDPPADFDAENNFIVLRYADVLLMLAEAIGESPEAYVSINKVRERSGLAPIGPDTPGTFEEKLLHERRVELAFEFHRWPDLKRFGMVEEVLDEQAVHEVNPLFPIPQREIDVAPDVMKQNPGY